MWAKLNWLRPNSGPRAAPGARMEGGTFRALRHQLRKSQSELADELNRRLGRSYDRPKLSKNRYVGGRATLRETLAATRGERATDVVIGKGPLGKPYVEGGPHFNLSHSDHLFLLAVAGFELGVDIEALRPIDEGVVALVFTAAEQAVWRAVPLSERDVAFLRCWTRKEAMAKACGEGLSSMKDYEVAFGDDAGVWAVCNDVAEARRWQLCNVSVEAGFVGAVAARRTGWVLTGPIPGDAHSARWLWP